MFQVLHGSTVRLNRAHLFGAQLAGVRFSGAELGHATLFGAHAPDADFSGADLTGTNLTSAHLVGAAFAQTDGVYPASFQIGVDANGDPRVMEHPWAGLKRPVDPILLDPCGEVIGVTAARMVGANFAKADLTGAFMVGVRLADATLADARISGAEQLELT